jgi:beta-glucosidase
MSEPVASLPPADAPYRQAALPVAVRVEDLLARMTLAEKLGQLDQGFRPYQDERPVAELCRRAAAGDLGSVISFGAEVHDRLQRAAVEGSRLGIPLIVGYDVIHGCRTIVPISLGLACAFAPDLFRRAQEMAAREARVDGVEWAFAPMCDVARDARWGRVSETCGEDPYLGAQCAVAQVQGFQGGDLAASDRVAACLKHFVGYSASVGGRDYCETEITAWTLRNLHLLSFHAGVEAGAATIMSSFNAIGGVPAVANRQTLGDILRGEWSFPGFVVSDWGAVGEQIEWGAASDGAEAARRAISAGNDMDMLSGHYRTTLGRQVEDGTLPLAVVDQAVRRVLTVKFKLGLFERPYAPQAEFDQAAHRALARECALRSAVLVTNSGILPLAAEPGPIALIGPFGDDGREQVGAWDNHNAGAGAVTLAAALRARYGAAVVRVVKGCAANLAPATRTLQDGTVVAVDPAAQADGELDLAGAVEAARAAAVVVMALGEPAGWSGENATRAHLGLTGRQQELFDAVAATGKPLVVVLTCGRPLVVPQVLERAQAVLIAWQGGTMAGAALVDLLSGDQAPSGRLAISIPRDPGQCPVHYNRMRSGRPGQRHYKDLSADAQFWFGHGLTYTTFAFGAVGIEPPADGHPAHATATITNTGGRAGEAVVQLYVRQLACTQAARPEQELRGFLRIGLQPQETRTVRFDLDDRVLGYVGLDGSWRVEAGAYQIWVAPRAHSGVPVVYRHHLPAV